MGRDTQGRIERFGWPKNRLRGIVEL
jgi:hypothetical protein